MTVTTNTGIFKEEEEGANVFSAEMADPCPHVLASREVINRRDNNDAQAVGKGEAGVRTAGRMSLKAAAVAVRQ
jgi:hypothetical protein